MRVGIQEDIADGFLHGFAGLEIVRIPPEPQGYIAVDFWIASLTPATSRRQWPHLAGVRVVQGLWSGVDALRAFVPQEVTLCNARGLHDGVTAEWAVTAALAMQKYLPFYVALQNRADWAGKGEAEKIYLLREGARRDPACPVLIDDVAGQCVLIVGYGAIGQAIEARLAPFGCRFQRVARTPRDGVAPVSELDTLLPWADIVILVTPLTSETLRLMNTARLALMKRGALLVNVGRGAVVDTDALNTALHKGLVRAALDVTDPEPLPSDHPLWSAPNLLITPHIATDTPSFLARSFNFAAGQAQCFAKGEPLQNVITGEY